MNRRHLPLLAAAAVAASSLTLAGAAAASSSTSTPEPAVVETTVAASPESAPAEPSAAPATVVPAPLPAPAPSGETVVRTVTVSGTSTISVAPDTATIDVGAEVIAPTGAEVMEQLATGSEALLQTLIEAGVPEEDVTTTNISLWPQYADSSSSSSTPEITGYVGSLSLRVDVGVDEVGLTLELLQQSVGDDFRINGLSFSHSDPESLLDQPRIDAVDAARAKAEVLAGAAGAQLGAVVAIQEGSVAPPVAFYARAEIAEADAGSIAVAPGQLDLSVTVTVTYELLV